MCTRWRGSDFFFQQHHGNGEGWWEGETKEGVQEETRLPAGSVAPVDRGADRALSWRWKWGEIGRFRRLRRKNLERWRRGVSEETDEDDLSGWANGRGHEDQ